MAEHMAALLWIAFGVGFLVALVFLSAVVRMHRCREVRAVRRALDYFDGNFTQHDEGDVADALRAAFKIESEG